MCGTCSVVFDGSTGLPVELSEFSVVPASDAELGPGESGAVEAAAGKED